MTENKKKFKTAYLHLRRRRGQSVIIGDHPNQVTLTLGETIDGETTLQFFAPGTVQIDRLEIARKKGRIISPEI